MDNSDKLTEWVVEPVKWSDDSTKWDEETLSMSYSEDSSNDDEVSCCEQPTDSKSDEADVKENLPKINTLRYKSIFDFEPYLKQNISCENKCMKDDKDTQKLKSDEYDALTMAVKELESVVLKLENHTKKVDTESSNSVSNSADDIFQHTFIDEESSDEDGGDGVWMPAIPIFLTSLALSYFVWCTRSLFEGLFFLAFTFTSLDVVACGVWNYLKETTRRKFIDRLDLNAKETEDGKYEVTFFINHQPKKIIIPKPKRRISPPARYYDQDGKDVTGVVNRYYKYYGEPVTPNTLFRSCIIKVVGEDNFRYDNTDSISL